MNKPFYVSELTDRRKLLDIAKFVVIVCIASTFIAILYQFIGLEATLISLVLVAFAFWYSSIFVSFMTNSRMHESRPMTRAEFRKACVVYPEILEYYEKCSDKDWTIEDLAEAIKAVEILRLDKEDHTRYLKTRTDLRTAS